MDEIEDALVEVFVDEGLGNSAYLVGSRAAHQAALIDPLRDVAQYLAAAERLGLTITHVLETHLHADFVSGARELAARVGAAIGASAEAGLGFDHRALVEGDAIALGGSVFEVVTTPGHTPEHIAFTLRAAEASSPVALFSGGALLPGGAARTDLISQDMTEPLAHSLYHTIHDKLLALPDATTVYPTHGAGSFCAATRGRTRARTTTIGVERAGNHLAQAQGEAEFVRHALSGLPSYPLYYLELRAVNRRGPRMLGGLPEPAPLTPEQAQAWLAGGGAVVDVRPAAAIAEAYIPGTYGIAVDAPLVSWAGWLIPFGTPLVLLTDSAAERAEAVRQLIRIGYDDLRGYLEGGLAAWEAAGLPVARIPKVAPATLREQLAGPEAPVVLDVRQDAEWRQGHIPGALHVENGQLPYDELPLPRDRTVVVYCGHADRSTAGVSVLARRGYRHLVLLEGGFQAWQASGLDIAQGDGVGP